MAEEEVEEERASWLLLLGIEARLRILVAFHGGRVPSSCPGAVTILYGASSCLTVPLYVACDDCSCWMVWGAYRQSARSLALHCYTSVVRGGEPDQAVGEEEQRFVCSNHSMVGSRWRPWGGARLMTNLYLPFIDILWFPLIWKKNITFEHLYNEKINPCN